MSMDDVQLLSGRVLLVSESRSRTHFVSDDLSEVWFVFVENKLKSVQVVWAHRVMEYAFFQQTQLCEDFEVPAARLRLPDNNQLPEL